MAALGELVTSLEQATLMAKQLPNPNSNPSHILQIYSSLHSAQHHLSVFLSQHPPPPSLFFNSPPPVPDNSVSSSAAAANDNYGDPMQLVDDDGNEAPADATIDGVEEKMRDCFIQKNKRPRRSQSPSAAAAVAEYRRRSYENEMAARGVCLDEFDPRGTRLRALDLIYQFHG
ncbi:hypothetical protein M9H77_33306 [Catharanthus roseus]|uniref:Uncharacterized protein n=1 Tax=Catharanthus roseus TaxID=4058 RepID=A0ACB9ZI61_CATRO|nr:hypothetical protein M9H77_33306 [Catharanthus roseus]